MHTKDLYSGYRKVTEHTYATNELAKQFKGLPDNMKRMDIYVAFKKVGKSLGVNSSQWRILDELISMSHDIDWQGDSRPIVWPSNDYLTQKLGIGRTTLQSNIRSLISKGLIAMKDSSNGRRFGYRDRHTNKIIEAYGFDLSPLAVRYAEFVELYEYEEEARLHEKELKRKFTILRRSIAMSIDSAFEQGLTGQWSDYRKRFEKLVEAIPRRFGLEVLQDLMLSFSSLKEQVDNSFISAINTVKSEPLGSENGAHIHNTNKQPLSNCNKITNSAYAEYSYYNNAAFSSNKDYETYKCESSNKEIEYDTYVNRRKTLKEDIINIGFVKDTCPTIQELYPDSMTSWHELVNSAQLSCHWLGISQDGWIKACGELGREQAAICVAIITEKYQSGDVISPGGYLRGMVNKAKMDELNISRTLFGLQKIKENKYNHHPRSC